MGMQAILRGAVEVNNAYFLFIYIYITLVLRLDSRGLYNNVYIYTEVKVDGSTQKPKYP